jgi:hypothetical protein
MLPGGSREALVGHFYACDAHGKLPMALFDGRPAGVTIDAPAVVSGMRELAHKAWRSINKEIAVKSVPALNSPGA